MIRCVMCLIRGTNGLCPCPWCLVPAEEQSNLSQKYPLRQVEGTKSIVIDESLAFSRKDEMLKSQGIRPLSVSNHDFIHYKAKYLLLNYIECILEDSFCKST